MKWKIFQLRNEENFMPMDLYFQGLKYVMAQQNIVDNFAVALIHTPDVSAFCCPGPIWNNVITNITKLVINKKLTFKNILSAMENKFQKAIKFAKENSIHHSEIDFKTWVKLVQEVARDKSCLCFWASTAITAYLTNNFKLQPKKISELTKLKKSELNKYPFGELITELQLISEILEKRNRLRNALIESINPLKGYLTNDYNIESSYSALLTANEINKILENKNYHQNICNERYKLSILLTDNRGTIVLVKQDAANFLSNVDNYLTYFNYKKDINYLQGLAAETGYTKGKARVVIKDEDFRKIKKGEILITAMTSPRFLSYIKKVAAIITDDGGITCHAAIISRELHIPCIVGTKIATKVLHDGDLVEVDADKGIIRKI